MWLALAIIASAASAHAQTVLQGNKLSDNWYIGIQAGGITPTTHSPFWKDMRLATGIEIGKQITPVLGLSFEGLTGINTTPSRTAFDDLRLTFLGKINLQNLIAGYIGIPRFFEVEAIGGIGWGHDFMNQAYRAYDKSYLSSKFGLNLNFNFGNSKAWTASIKPALVYRMDGNRSQVLNVNKSRIELLAGLTYHFKNSNGAHYMMYAEVISPEEMEAVNEKINQMRMENRAKDEALAASLITIKDLTTQLEAAEENIDLQSQSNTSYPSLEPVITFAKDQTTVSPQQAPIVENIANYLKSHPDTTIEINGYASPEGEKAVNERIAETRAQAVKDILVNQYHIKANRISARGQGVGNVFSEPKWNRASIIFLHHK